MDIDLPGLYDRRVAAADEYRTRNSRAIYLRDVRRGPDGRVVPVRARRNYDVRTRIPESARRDPEDITRVILHQTGFISRQALPATSDPTEFRTDDHRLDVVIAHFIVRTSGAIMYTHDVQLVLNGTAALRDSIEIEFEGIYNQRSRAHGGGGDEPWGPRVSRAAILAGRRLLTRLRDMSTYQPDRSPLRLLSIGTIHPHQQFSPDTRPNCPGPDIWVNVGEWAVRRFSWQTTDTRRGRTISAHMSNALYRQTF